MALREKLGRLVLLEETETGALGRECRAARLGPAGLDRLVTVLCFAPAVSSQAAATKRLMDEARLAARLQNPGLVRVLGIGRVEQVFYISTELIEGRTLASIFERCQRESFPFAADHALMVASRVASALEYLHGKKDDAGNRLFHGLLAPSRVVLSYDGEVKIKGLGLWAALRDSDLFGPSDRAYVAPEQAAGEAGDPRSDVYALGLVLLQALTGRSPDGRDPRADLAHAQVVSVSGESSPLPKLLADTLERALAADPASRYSGMAEMRKAIDTLLFSGDFTPTTFDLAFFMHTLFRDDMDRESRAIDEARRADYREFLDEKPAAVPVTPASAAPALTPPPAEATVLVHAVSEPTLTAAAVEPAAPVNYERPPTPVLAAPTIVEHPQPPTEPPARAVGEPSFAAAGGAAAEFPVAETSRTPHLEPRASEHHDHHAVREHRPAREAGGRDASVRLALATPAAEPSRRGLWIALAGVLALGLIGGGLWVFVAARAKPPAAQPAALSPEAAAAMARVKELESRLADLEKQRLDAEAKAAEDARKEVEARAAARGRAVDAAALQKAQEEAKQRARAEQEARQQLELRRLAEAKKAEEARLAEEIRVAQAAAAATTTTTTTTTPAAPAGPTITEVASAPPSTVGPAVAPATTPSPTAAPLQPGALVQVNDPKLIPPFQLSGNRPVYPPLAAQHGIEGTVELSALIDENGRVAEVSVVRAKPRNVGFEAAAIQAVRSRRYRPGTKDGVAVRVWIAIRLEFKPRR